ncbi:cytochrome c biogenesis protein CcdA [Aquisalimonas lutea]|uniref:cytochrome c biogenesis CcdA family protein n=1 Tax=Aquisalimonas lutea TaxID=1327750 RepID=UPI0025B5D687|nr:cytochrome c biogenesis protein CcdA [Aquisalimonas lutea]MDN3519084.1 cytochrome c biogenesis protein CcdA [Aquisalimonas lutea]
MSEWAIGYPTVVLAGAISFLSPCVLPLVPGYVSFMAGDSITATRAGAASVGRRLTTSTAFVVGFSLIFVTMGAGATALGRSLLYYRDEANLIGGGLVVLFGLFMTGLIRPRWLLGDYRAVTWVGGGGTPMAAGVLGVAFGVGWTPCIGPVLGAVLTIAATSGGDIHGTALLSAYSLGLGVPFILAALFTDRFVGMLARLRLAGRWLHLVAGGVMVAIGVLMMTGLMTRFSYWLLEVFPALERIG